ncbi:amino acid adenylation domain protein [Haliangium ochraceum DSM 14365]|uniref:Amino acid adenylation domain protein n=2 Tax=Haliangium ochraceum TaxID=80816 RepID=D0LNU3_HALO1|nr:amino acid adenylation domain protein [Haliangium ochraceum DSM 14365]
MGSASAPPRTDNAGSASEPNANAMADNDGDKATAEAAASAPRRPVHERFEHHAARAPQAPAVRFGDEQLSYAQLDERAERVAALLSARGIGREDRVVVALPPSLHIAEAVLGILKAGAVYVPLDPGFPDERLRVILRDTVPALILTQAALTPRFAGSGFPSFAFDDARDSAELAAMPTRAARALIDPQQTVSIYYTSGTTGEPKGVMASHANLASYIGSACERYGFGPGDVGPALARFSFSISMFELLCPLSSGGCLLVLEREHVLDFGRLAETLRDVAFFHAGPSLLRGLLAYLRRHYPDLSVFAGVKHASSGGDMVPVEVLEGLREVFCNAEVFVIYGCSEISCMGCTYEAPREGPLTRSYVGHAFEGTVVRVLDDVGADAPVGEVGEVWFAGPGVVKGYLNRPELTRERFVERDGQRFYRTGDRGRFDAEGRLELVGRSDFQVKLGGIRIELGEIEHHLRRAPGVDNGVVAARALPNGDKELVAYVVPDASQQATSAGRERDIRNYLGEQLPDYMVPSVFVELAALPLNHNMKIDRRALPEPPAERLRPVAAPLVREPATPHERYLAELFSDALGLAQVGLDDNFFDLGGHSLLALGLIEAVDAKYGVSLSGLELLREPLEILARLCEQRSGTPASSARAAAQLSRPAEAPELFYFGQGDSLFGALHGAELAPAAHAVLLCAPPGHEYLRAHFVMQRLARRLAAGGVPVLRFDYFGCRDALGESQDATSQRWQQDIVAAHAELVRRTRAERVSALGVRLGGTLLTAVAEQLSLAHLVLWDPVDSGRDHLRELEEAHAVQVRASTPPGVRRALRDLLGTLRPAPARAPRELLGMSYSPHALDELAQLERRAAPGERIVRTEAEWMDLARLEDMLPDRGLSARLGAALLEDA